MKCQYFWVRYAAVPANVARSKSATTESPAKKPAVEDYKPIECYATKGGTIRHMAKGAEKNARVGFTLLYGLKSIPADNSTLNEISFFAKEANPEVPYTWFDPHEAADYPDKAPANEQAYFNKWRAGGHAVVVGMGIDIP